MALVDALNPKRYRVEHVHDACEALLRAEVVLAHAVLAFAPELPSQLEARIREAVARGIAVVVATEPTSAAAQARELGAAVLRWPASTEEIKRAVARAVEAANSARERALLPRSARALTVGASGEVAVERPRVLVMMRDRESALVVAAVLESAVKVACDVDSSPRAAMARFPAAYACALVEPELLVGAAHGGLLGRELAQRGVPVIPLHLPPELDADVAGAAQVAWAVVPQLRQSLRARRGP